MPKTNRPRRGSMQYWPRKRAKRIYHSSRWVNDKAKFKDAKPIGFAAWKAGMTHVQLVDANSKSPTYGKTITKAVTVLESPPIFVLGFRVYKQTSYGPQTMAEVWSDNIPKDVNLNKKTVASKKKTDVDALKNGIFDVRLIIASQPGKGKMEKKKPDVLELGIGGDVLQKLEFAKSMVGKELYANDIFKPGDYVDVSAVTKGHGFTGTVKRFGIRIQGRKDQQKHRTPGSIGSTVPRKVDWRVPMPGQHGFSNRTEFNKKVIVLGDDGSKINPSGGFLRYGFVGNNFMVIEGSIPGSAKRLVVVRKALRQRKKELPIDLKYISLDSKQGV